MSTHNIYFRREIRKLFVDMPTFPDVYACDLTHNVRGKIAKARPNFYFRTK